MGYALDYITIEGFKSIASIRKLALGRVNVLIGVNGAGKSNFIGAFSFLQKIQQGHLQRYVKEAGGAEKLLYFGSKVTNEIHFLWSFGNEFNQYELSLLPSQDDALFPSGEVISSWDKAERKRPYSRTLLPGTLRREAGISSSGLTTDARLVSDQLSGWRIYHFADSSSSSPMRKTTQVDDNRFLRADGSNLTAFLYLLRQKHFDSYSLIHRTIQQVAPFFEDFQLEPLKLKPDTIKLEWSHKSSDKYFDASSLSDGTLRFIALAALFLQPTELLPSLILIDEPELGLHPYAIGILAALIKQASSKTQVIVSTQSSLLLDHFQPEDVLVAERVDGATEIKRVNSQELTSWLDDYSLGQLWEKNEIGGRPVGN